MKKLLAVFAASAVILGGCQSNTTNSSVPGVPVENMAINVEQDSNQENADDFFNAVFKATNKGYSSQIQMDTEIEGNKVNFLNAGELVQMDSTVVDGYEDERLFYQAEDALYSTSHVEDKVFEASQTIKCKEKILSAHKDGAKWSVFQVDEINGDDEVQQAKQFLAIPFNYQELQSDAFHLNPLENSSYYEFTLKPEDDNYEMVIAIKDKEAYTQKNKELMVENQYNMDIFQKFDIEEDTYTLKLDPEGVLSEVTHTISAVYVVNNIEQKEEIETTTKLEKASNVDVSFLQSLFADDMKIGSTFVLK